MYTNPRVGHRVSIRFIEYKQSVTERELRGRSLTMWPHVERPVAQSRTISYAPVTTGRVVAVRQVHGRTICWVIPDGHSQDKPFEGSQVWNPAAYPIPLEYLRRLTNDTAAPLV